MRIAYFEKLDLYYIFIAIFLKIFIKKIIYRELDARLNHKKFLKIILFFNIENIDFFMKNNNFFKAHNNLDIFEEKLIKTISKNLLVKNFIQSEFKNKEKDIVYRSICNSFGNYKLWPLTFYYFQKKLKNYKIIYFPKDINGLVVLNIFKFKNVFVVSFKIYISLILNFFKKVNKIKKIKKDKNIKILYFPHKNLLYGKIFKKNFLYKEPKIVDKILTIYFDKIEKFDLKFFSLNKLKFKIIKRNNMHNSTIKKGRPFFNNDLYFLNLKILHFIEEYNVKKKFLENYPNLKVSYIFFEEIFDDYSLILAFKNKKIKILSHMERSALSALYNSPRIIDHYFVPSEGMKKMLIKRKNIVKQYHIVGFLRTGLAKKEEKLFLNSLINTELNNVKKKIILCLPIGFANKINASVYGDIMALEKSHIYFIKSIIRLANLYKNYLFIIKSKFDNDLEYNQKLLQSKIIINKNILLLQNSPYDLIPKSDLIISKYTSVIEEILPLKKRIILIDEYKYYSNSPLFIKYINIISHNFNETEAKFNFFVKKKKYYDMKDLKNISYYFGNSKKNVSKEICKFIIKLL